MADSLFYKERTAWQKYALRYFLPSCAICQNALFSSHLKVTKYATQSLDF
jgi:hypothetical protein